MGSKNYPIEIEIEVEESRGNPALVRDIASDIVKEYKGITYPIALDIVKNDRWHLLGRYNKRDL